MNTTIGMISVESPHGVEMTTNKLESALKHKGMTIIARVDHAENALLVGSTLRPTQLLIFGNPKVGTPMIRLAQSVGIDLPQKILVWEDENDQVWMSYNDPKFIAMRHGVNSSLGPLSDIFHTLQQVVCEAVEISEAPSP